MSEEKKEITDLNWLSDQDVEAEEERRKKMKQLYTQYLTTRSEIVQNRKFSPPEEVNDYVFKDWEDKDVKLSELFGDKDQLILIINMGTKCPYCTMWADGYNGQRAHFEDAAAFVVLSNDPPPVQKAFAESRGWKFRMVSGYQSTFTKDLNNENPPERAMMGTCVKPGVNTFELNRETGKIVRVARDSFGENDHFQPVFRLLELTNVKGWHPKLEYPDRVGQKRKRDELDRKDETEPINKKQKL